MVKCASLGHPQLMADSDLREKEFPLSKLSHFRHYSLTGCPKRKVSGLIGGEDDIFGTKGLGGLFKGSGESTTVKEKVREVIRKVCKQFCLYL